jgi:glycosyltransferase involved in cell wall biosynthesis
MLRQLGPLSLGEQLGPKCREDYRGFELIGSFFMSEISKAKPSTIRQTRGGSDGLNVSGSVAQSKGSYVVAFNRDRDSYQVPLALHEAGKLDLLLTDLYEPSSRVSRALFRRVGLGHRFCAGLKSEKTDWSWRAIWLQLVALRFAKTPEARNRVFNAIDRSLSEAAGKAAERLHSALFLYSGYAREAFLRHASSRHLKLLFVYHPQGEFVREILVRDRELHPEACESHRSHLAEIDLNEGHRVQKELGLANAIVCASSFTAASVASLAETAGKMVSVVPYGFDGAAEASQGGDLRRAAGKARVLFVGQGVQRKGLHHLIKAWSDGLYRHAELTLVLSRLDSGIAKLINTLPVQPRLLSGLSRAELRLEYEYADIFVLPSLVEGFGLVYLEALAAGCLVVGTANTGLPDLQLGHEAVRLVPPGNINLLSLELESAIKDVSEGQIDRGVIRQRASAFPWRRFREGIRQFVCDAESSVCREGFSG